MTNKGLFTSVCLGALVCLSSNTNAFAPESTISATPGNQDYQDCRLVDVVDYCIKNWRTLPEKAGSVCRDAWEQNAPAMLVMIGGHGKGNGKSGDIPPPPKGNGGGVGGAGDIPSDPGGKKPPGGATPEPTALVLGLFGIGCASVSFMRRRRRSM